MGWILRTSSDLNNPTLPGGVYGKYITAGRPVYWRYDGSRTRGILFISDGGKYGMDSVDSFEYKGAIQDPADWIFHRGTLPAQIVPKTAVVFGAVPSNFLTVATHGYADATPVRLGVISGDLGTGVNKDTIYYAKNEGTNEISIWLDSGLTSSANITALGSGTMLVWHANTGFDDPEQGLPTFVPEVGTTFSGISYIEFKLPSGVSSLTDQPEWENFRVVGFGRRLMDYDDTGSETGLVSGGDDLLSNVALEVVDNALNNYEVAPDRLDWDSWFDFRTAAHVEIWQRVVISDDPATPSGFIGRYYGDGTFTNLIVTRHDATIDFDFGTDPPAPGVPQWPFSVRWTAQIKPRYTELYTLTFEHDDSVRCVIDGSEILYVYPYGTDSVTFNFVADQTYDIVVELVQGPGGSNPSKMKFSWQSASQALEIVPSTRVFPSDEIVRRYECHTAFPTATEASEVHERLMERAPGWEWTDKDGLVQFLGPDREPVFAFAFDRMDDDSRANFVRNTFIKKRRALIDRKNFALFRFRNVRDTGFPFAFVQADRPDLREFTNGEPSNDPATDLGVSTRSLAERVGEMSMVMGTDPDHTANLSGGRKSSLIRKNELVTVSYYDQDDNYVADDRYLVTFHSWGAKNEQNDYTLLPLPENFYTDEPVT